MRSHLRMVTLWVVLVCVGIVSAQGGSCPVIVAEAFARADESCSDIGRNQACYGNVLLDTEPQPYIDVLNFDASGDRIDVADILAMDVAPLDEVNAHWGVAILSLQASIPNSLPGQNVTFVLFGDVGIEADPAGANPMQAFYLRTGIGDAACEEAPESGILVQSPDGVEEVTFTVNGLDVQLGSTAYIQAEPGNEMTVSVLEGTGIVNYDGAIYPVIAGTWTRMPINEEFEVTGAPTLPLGYGKRELRGLPIALLPRLIEIAPPLDGRVLDRLHNRLLTNNLPCGDFGLPSCSTLPPMIFEGQLPPSDGWGLPPQNDDTPPPDAPPPPPPPRDSDGDGFSNNVDACPFAAGIAAYSGCPPPPDSDGDGFNDTVDQCPAVVGTVNGCPPDADGDGIPDSDDLCPQEPGTLAADGCPELIGGEDDQDGDGLVDTADLCPTLGGLVDENGCPLVDTDGDGLPDENDNCPSDAGPLGNSGCPLPDSDGDGIPDLQDACPQRPGVASNNGCPPDSDGDGLLDDIDECPDQGGIVDANGCPLDSDGDGVVDNVDQCPSEGGIVDANGCPLDSDGDGVVDNVDQCPSDGGIVDEFGCPKDTDGDGVVDNVDECPDLPGDPDNFGCPVFVVDSDGDGLTDDIDQCPDQGGIVDANGCPLDSDGDGVVDNVDECPDQGDIGYGVDQNGCPIQPVDSDGDGFTDDVDACPNEPAPDSQDGCPLSDRDGDGFPDDVDECPDQGDIGYGVDEVGCPIVPA